MRRRLIALAAVLLGGAAPVADAPRWDAAGAANPLLPGYFADPSIVHDNGRWYIFATVDPWGDDRLGLWTSDNGRDWRFSMPDWPTKRAATSPTSGDAKVWAPSVVKAPNGRWYMYVSVGSEVWVGTAPTPAGPWRDANGGKPLIARDFAPAYHMIDAEAFVDDDGQAYLYWGSGLNWINGHCFVVRLKSDMVTFDGAPRDVTPRGYFEAPFMVKAGGRYLLTYSDGNTTKDTYKVRYAVGSTPFGPFTEGPNSPILETHRDRDVVSPGHHAIFRSDGQSYILYHRQALPWPQTGDAVLRQVAIDPVDLRGDGSIARVMPGHGGPVAGFAPHRTRGLAWRASGDATGPLDAPAKAADDNYATLWRAPADGSGTLVADLGRRQHVARSLIRPEYAMRPYQFAVDASDDGKRWRPLVAATTQSGSPIVLDHAVSARYLRLRVEDRGAGVWEWTILP